MRILLAAFSLTALLPAQRPDATFELQKRITTISYGAVPVGQHSLADLKVGESWRLGMNEASTWELAMPILAGEAWIAPGEYRVNLVRKSETQCELAPNGCHQAIDSGEEARVAGEVKKAGKPSKKLSIEWQKQGAAAAGNQPARITVQFGETQWQGDVLVLGHKAANVAGGKLAVFSVPAARVTAGPVPIASLQLTAKGKDDGFNVVLDKTKVRLVPWMTAPKTSFGFGEIAPPDKALVTEGTVTVTSAATDKPLDVLTLREASLAKGELRLVVAYGSDTAEIKLPEPKAKAGK